MKKYNIGFIGCGKMASAIIRGLIKSGFAQPTELLATQAETEEIEAKSKEMGIEIILDNKELVKRSDIVVIAVKPNQAENVLEEIHDIVTPDKLLVSIAAGVTTKFLESKLADKTRVIRVMPNTPALVGEGMSGICGGKFAKTEDLEYIKNMLSAIGKCIIVNEAQIDIVTAISGSGPAFFYKVINDIARAGEKLGLEYEKSLLLSIQTAIGSAKMAMNRTISMEELISNVATKGGCTRVGIDCMEEFNTEKIFYDVVKSTTNKAHALGK